ncbi:hypothetical protein BYT27DRAFT_7194108 [Phlegmacium glaucopus]|nr:hypothetical protein BYT27DRAFT_7194108 [Phlegmacium glaucopus]
MAACTTSSPIDPLSKCNIGPTNSHTSNGNFAFARINDEVHLVQVSCATPVSALTTVDVKIFRHEFITIFRFSESKTFHPADICIVEPIDDRLTRYEEENETVFLARDLVARMRMMANPTRMGQSRRNQIQRLRQR